MIDAVKWLVVSALIGVPLIGSLYIICTPAYKLSESWQNWKISRAHRPLKDEHFKGLSKTIRVCKLLSVLVALIAFFGLVALILSMTGPAPAQ
jgi:predicted RND superfamily exporter protein